MIHLNEKEHGEFFCSLIGSGILPIGVGVLGLFASLGAGCEYGPTILGGIIFLASCGLIALPFNVCITKW